MLSLIASVIGLIPGLTNLAAQITQAAFDAKVKMMMARTGADRDAVVALIQKAATDAHESTAKWQAIASNPILLVIVILGGGPYFLYAWKCIVWDTLLGLGTTDPIRGDLATWGSIVYTGLFGGASAATLGAMWFNRPGAKG